MHSRAEGVVWLWQAHNTVNLRLAAEEAADAGGNLYKYDPAFPKAAWPPPELCAACRKVRLVFRRPRGGCALALKTPRPAPLLRAQLESCPAAAAGAVAAEGAALWQPDARGWDLAQTVRARAL